VNLVRFSPGGERVLVTKGEIAGSEDVTAYGCSMRVLIKAKDVDDYIHKCEDFGNHNGVIFGDYTDRISEVGRYLGFEIVET
jgi:hypothetical protein